ncbi:ribosome recycling factor [bacterium (Candidatus Gribaldobacteria) CG08_land_8_20_14_0_20_39_15]|uniref:Ribosome recycling factor n=1 Tax=bacterium (Candidatus Gribaldobacteria) CG08_land_8_20_14_0_20_39_15 TaxID=2014273 RepID=A0A2M6XVA3_9BACT|nr:MAG: ribosome recycling factor [bacterium (Candidatus Gribaldobacteria) CG08_land_8_20_14_0_20_39_15]
MIYQEIVDKTKADLQKAVEDFKAEVAKLRSNRLSPALLEDIEVNCFGSFMPMKQLGAIANGSPRELMVELWDKSYVEGVVKAVEQAELGLGVRIDDKIVYFSAPPLTEETRQNVIKMLDKKKEEAFQVLRHFRDKAWKEIQETCQKGELREDDKFKGKDKLDETTREFREKIEEIAKRKEEEIKG